MKAPITHIPSRHLVKASDGQHYLLTPNKTRSLAEFGGGHRIFFTYQYRRCDESGNITPRVRQSKKNRIRARRLINA